MGGGGGGRSVGPPESNKDQTYIHTYTHTHIHTYILLIRTYMFYLFGVLYNK